MEQNEMIEEVETEKMEVDNVVEESSIEELETEKVEQTSEKSGKGEVGISEAVEPDKSQDTISESESPEKSDELYQKLKTEIMEEIRKYFDPILKEKNPVTEILDRDETLNVERKDNLINRIIDESGW